MTTGSDCPSEEDLVRMVEGALGDESLSVIEQHVDTCEHCAAVLAGLGGLEQSQVRRTLGRYQLDRRIAAGGMGEVWAAWDPQLRRELAIKFVRPDRADDGRERDRLLREARALARLTHPNVLAVHDVGEIDGEVFLVTELVAGDTLATRGGPSSDWRALVRLYAQAARGLAAAHAAGLVHRDVKPANLLIGADGRVRVADFGLAVRSSTPSPHAPTEMPSLGASSKITAAGHIAGTPAYMAPEQRAGMAAEGPADQFALCVALGEGIAGRRPPTAPESSALRSFVAERRAMDSDLDALCGVLAKGLALDPDDRFESMAALAEALELVAGPAPDPIGGQPSGRMRRISGEQRQISGQHRIIPPAQSSGTGSSSQNATTARTARQGPARTLGIVALIVLVAGAAAGGLYLAMRDRSDEPAQAQPPEPAPPSTEPLGASRPATPASTLDDRGVATTDETGAPRIPGTVDDAPGTEPSGTPRRPGSGDAPAKPSTGSAGGVRPIAAPASGGPPRTAERSAGDVGVPAPPPEDDPVRNGPGMAPTTPPITAASTVTLADVNRAISRRDGKACRAALAKLASPPPTDFRVASAHALCEMVAGNCEGGLREQRALRVREGSNPDSAEISAELYCPVDVADPAVRLRRLSRQLSMFTWFECSYYLPAARASGKVVANDREKLQVGSALATIAKCYSDREDCTTARKVLTEAQAFIPALGVSELNAACR
ncbi:MAG: protein kinase [Myxococcales bacterium]|nr:protein kinase [Myxococcales bacterium]